MNNRSNHSPTITSGFPWGKLHGSGIRLPELETEGNPVVARLYGPRGELIYVKREKSWVPFGFRGSRG